MQMEEKIKTKNEDILHISPGQSSPILTNEPFPTLSTN